MNSSDIIQGLPPTQSPRVGRVFQLFGPETVMVAIKPGTKEPIQKSYPDFNGHTMTDPGHLQLLEANSIAISMGPVSGDLASIDFDDEEAFEQFCASNPQLSQTIRSVGARGCNLWFRLVGEYPQVVKKLLGCGGKAVGEWRGGGITIVSGRHPAGHEYTIDASFPIRQISFEDVQWPGEWTSFPGRVDPFEELTKLHGPWALAGERGGVQINEAFIVAWILAENHIALAKEDACFYRYQEESGIWMQNSSGEMDRLIHSYIARLASESGMEKVHFLNRSAVATSIRRQLAARASEEFFLPRVRDGWFAVPANNAVVAVVPASSGVAETIAAMDFRPSSRFVAKSEVDFVAGADCPRFFSEVLAPVLHPDDILLLQKMLGLALIGVNDVQKILLLEGPGDLGKGVLIRVVQKVLGSRLTTELRTRHLDSRFETSRFLGKRLLLGQDVQTDFLNTRGAALLKALTGGDAVGVETKNSNVPSELWGRFHIFITSNAPLTVRIEADASAWSRRLVIIPFHPPSGGLPQRIPRFEDVLVRAEGSGILNWMLHGALAACADIHAYGTIRLTLEQTRRVEERVRASDSVGVFVSECLFLQLDGEIGSQALLDGYLSFCRDRGFAAVAGRIFLTQIKSEFEARWAGQVQTTENLNYNGSRCRGYRGVGLLSGAGPHVPHG